MPANVHSYLSSNNLSFVASSNWMVTSACFHYLVTSFIAVKTVKTKFQETCQKKDLLQGYFHSQTMIPGNFAVLTANRMVDFDNNSMDFYFLVWSFWTESCQKDQIDSETLLFDTLIRLEGLLLERSMDHNRKLIVANSLLQFNDFALSWSFELL